MTLQRESIETVEKHWVNKPGSQRTCFTLEAARPERIGKSEVSQKFQAWALKNVFPWANLSKSLGAFILTFSWEVSFCLHCKPSRLHWLVAIHYGWHTGPRSRRLKAPCRNITNVCSSQRVRQTQRALVLGTSQSAGFTTFVLTNLTKRKVIKAADARTRMLW